MAAPLMFTATATQQRRRPPDPSEIDLLLAVSDCSFTSFLSDHIGGCRLPTCLPMSSHVLFQCVLQRALSKMQRGVHHLLLKILRWLPIAHGLETMYF